MLVQQIRSGFIGLFIVCVSVLLISCGDSEEEQAQQTETAQQSATPDESTQSEATQTEEKPASAESEQSRTTEAANLVQQATQETASQSAATSETETEAVETSEKTIVEAAAKLTDEQSAESADSPADSAMMTEKEEPGDTTENTDSPMAEAEQNQEVSTEETSDQQADSSAVEPQTPQASDETEEAAGWRAAEGDDSCCGTGCAKECAADMSSAPSQPQEAQALVMNTDANSADSAKEEAAGWRPAQGDESCCGTGCATECEADTSGASSEPVEAQVLAMSTDSTQASEEAAGWRPAQGDDSCCGTGCAKECVAEQTDASATETGAAEPEMAKDSADESGAGWRPIAADEECCGTGCATECSAESAAADTSTTADTGTPTQTDDDSAAGWRPVQGDDSCCGTGCAKECVPDDSASAESTMQTTGSESSGGAGWRAIQGDPSCCGTGCAAACEADTADAQKDAAASDTQEDSGGSGWRKIEADDSCCGTGCAKPCESGDASEQQSPANPSETDNVDVAVSGSEETAGPAEDTLQQAGNTEQESNGQMAEKSDLYTVQGNKVDTHTWIGSKIYQRVFGRGCATCHDVQSNPNLTVSLKSIERTEFADIMRNGKNNGKMPPTIGAIMALGPVKKAGLSEDQAIDAVYAYLRGRALGDIPPGRVGKIQ